MKKGFSSSSSILERALIIRFVGSWIAAIVDKYVKASLSSWYPAAMVVSIAF